MIIGLLNRSNQVESNQIKSNQIESNRIESNQIKSNQIEYIKKSNEPHQIKANLLKSNQIASKSKARGPGDEGLGASARGASSDYYTLSEEFPGNTVRY